MRTPAGSRPPWLLQPCRMHNKGESTLADQSGCSVCWRNPRHTCLRSCLLAPAPPSHLRWRLVVRRLAEAQQKRRGAELQCDFVATPDLGIKEWREEEQYDVVTCMFAIHYFFVSEAALKQVPGAGNCRGSGGLGEQEGECLSQAMCRLGGAGRCKPAAPGAGRRVLRRRAAVCLACSKQSQLLASASAASAPSVPAQRVHQPEGGRLLLGDGARRQARERVHPPRARAVRGAHAAHPGALAGHAAVLWQPLHLRNWRYCHVRWGGRQVRLGRAQRRLRLGGVQVPACRCFSLGDMLQREAMAGAGVLLLKCAC